MEMCWFCVAYNNIIYYSTYTNSKYVFAALYYNFYSILMATLAAN